MAERGSAGTTNCTKNSVVLGSLHAVAGEAECATTQTVHFASSRALECWWAAKLHADTTVSKTQSHTTGFKTDRMKVFPSGTVPQMYNGMKACARVREWSRFWKLRATLDCVKSHCTQIPRCRFSIGGRSRLRSSVLLPLSGSGLLVNCGPTKQITPPTQFSPITAIFFSSVPNT